MECSRCTSSIRAAVVIGLTSVGIVSPIVLANDAPLFTRPFNGVPLDSDELFIQIVPAELIDSTNDEQRHLDPGGGPRFDPPNLPPRFTERKTTPSPTGMTAGGAYFGQFVDHDLTKTRLRFDEILFPPFVFRFMELAGGFQNRRTPGFDLDPVYRINPLEWPSVDGDLGPWDASNLRFRFGANEIGGLDFIRQENGEAIIGDSRNDVTGIIGQIHRAFMQLHNEQVDRIVERDDIDEDQLEFLSQLWWDIFNEARNYATAYYQGIVANEYATHLTGRSIFEALDDRVYPLGPLELPQTPLEFSGSVFRLHTLIPTQIQIGPDTFVGPVDEVLRLGVPWIFLFGPTSPLAGRLDTAVAAPLREIVNLVIPGTMFPITIDLAQINLLRGRELALPSGEEYLAFLLDELGLDPRKTTSLRGKQILTPKNAAGFLDPVDDADLLADLQNGDTDLWAYIQLEPQLNDGLLGPVGQDILERTWAGLLLGDDWSLLGKFSDQFTPQQMDFFRSATFDRMVDEFLSPADLDRDGDVDVSDLLNLLANWGPCGDCENCPQDINGDCAVGVVDLLILLGEWGS